jgi:hypothetical protein
MITRIIIDLSCLLFGVMLGLAARKPRRDERLEIMWATFNMLTMTFRARSYDLLKSEEVQETLRQCANELEAVLDKFEPPGGP